jgi:Domain of unknown function (DUF4375)
LSVTRSLPEFVDTLVSLTPGSAAAEAPQHAIESLLMDALRSGGRPAGEALVDGLAGHGYRIERIDALPCMWRVAIPPPRVLEIWFTGGNVPAVAALSYRIGKPWGSKKERSAATLQAAFYERYGQLARQVGAKSPDERLIQLVGELEADLNNGGFDQYLRNQGEERGREALASLSVIGASRTGRWLASALEAGPGADVLERLDEQFYAKPEDLASLVMTHIRRRK